MPLARALLVSVLAFSVPSIALAQDDDTEQTPKKKKKKKAPKAAAAAEAEPAADEMPDVAPAPKEAEAAPTAKPDVTATSDQGRFKIKRGFFAESDLGVYMTFGGRNVNNPLLPSRPTSNVQPHLGVTLGYDVASTESFNLGIGLRFAMGLSGGAGRVTASEVETETVQRLQTRSNDFSVMEIGLQAGASILLSDRVALTIKGDGGMGIVDPDPTQFADVETGGKAGFAPVFGVGTGLEYYTLLNDFSVGFTLRFQGVLLDGLIPAASVTIPIKYTF